MGVLRREMIAVFEGDSMGFCAGCVGFDGRIPVVII